MDSKIFLENGRIQSKGYAMLSKDAKFTPFEFTRHAVGDNDILIKILYAGICHSDIHTARSEWGEAVYPCVPGHEIAGEVIAVGKNVSKFKVGDYAGVGSMVNSCGECEACKKSQEQFCEKGQTIYTCNSCDIFHDNENTYGGYSNNIVVSEKFAVCVPKDAPMEKVAPLLCAGIATYSPLKFSNIKAGSSVAVAGFGGVGMMAVKYAVKMGAKVSVFARNENKKADALAMGVSSFYTSTDKNAVKERFDLIISTIPTPYNPAIYLDLLKFGGEMAIVGLPPHEVAPSISVITFVHKAGKKVYGSLIGGIAETQEMLDFSLKHKIYPETELITSKDIDKAYENLTSGKAKFRYVIDMRDE
ncbi:TPA: NAD(P)-dependent alcohol dehydrogenase [Campylobacter coli]|nr:NAD(P)-dependent alcohol dehydrogenase [Campylobacter coli]HEF9090899.1 NAD(P)-dependent alcohol dehydrogenase [Campylobacter coli]HEF9110618.1 NAD(P)-dependent alcohol dehydrogenase [Campylobacter coli]HEF9303882.1 NAD(P)-dependent alcohol dehydrogenase [Campylobacter coli]HEF9328714.1 NAD(P)-dependent alcohol dehydrogenase [Campylobacter coli]